jgi:hypothetical protein
MSIRSFLLTAAIGFAGFGTATASASPVTPANGGGGGGFVCQNGDLGVGCIGTIAVLPITVLVKDVGVLDNNDLKILSDDLNNVSILDGGILNNDKILNDVDVTVLNDFLDKFGITVDKNDVSVCVNVLGLCL